MKMHDIPPDFQSAVYRVEQLEAELEALNKMRTHCENCGADYVATGIEAGCPCLLKRALELACDNNMGAEDTRLRVERWIKKARKQ